jgi:Fe-S-cluster containining protein
LLIINPTSKKAQRLDMSDDVVRKTCAFDVCCHCKSGCCQSVNPPLTLKRKKLIENYLKEQGIRVENPFTNEAYSYPAVDAMGFCVFFDKDTRKCLVHPVKPETCRAGPVTFDINCRTRKVEWYLKTTQVCALAKTLCENGTLFGNHFEAAREQLLRLICGINTEALQAILKIEEPQTVKIGEEDLPEEVMEKLGLEQHIKR